MSDDKKPKTGIWALFAKIGGKISSVFVKLLKSFKLIKVGLAAASLVGYSVLYNWKFAILLMVAIGWHEQGHVWAMRRKGIKTKGWYAIPFIGGAAIAEDEFKSDADNAYVSIMGPIWGFLMAAVAMGLYYITGQPLWAAAAGWMGTLNLFNLLPITPLDGGRIMRCITFSIHRWLGVVFLILSLVAGFVFMIHFHIGIFALLLAVGALELFVELNRRWKLSKYQQGLISKWSLPSSMLDDSQPDGIKKFPATMNAKQLALVILSYVGTTLVLVAIVKLMAHVPGADLAANFLE
jgi:putative peptide zinc metalloprotease protein